MTSRVPEDHHKMYRTLVYNKSEQIPITIVSHRFQTSHTAFQNRQKTKIIKQNQSVSRCRPSSESLK